MQYLISSTNTGNTGDVWPLWSNTVSSTTTGTGLVWRQWVNCTNGQLDATGIPDMGTTTAHTTWALWNGASNTTTATSVPTLIWNNWNQGGQIRQAPESPEIVAARRQREEDFRKLRAEEDRKRALADERATQLLVSMLSEEQKKDFAAHGHFFVDAPVSGRRYRIDKGRSGNIKVIDRVTNTWTESLCIHQGENVPIPDTMLMQKLLIETAEDELRKVANITRKGGGYDYGRGVLDGERLAQVIPFVQREAA